MWRFQVQLYCVCWTKSDVFQHFQCLKTIFQIFFIWKVQILCVFIQCANLFYQKSMLSVFNWMSKMSRKHKIECCGVFLTTASHSVLHSRYTNYRRRSAAFLSSIGHSVCFQKYQYMKLKLGFFRLELLRNVNNHEHTLLWFVQFQIVPDKILTVTGRRRLTST